MSSDDARKPADVRFRSAGSCHAVTKLCDACMRPRGTLGGRFARIGPIRLWHCAACAAKKEAA